MARPFCQIGPENTSGSFKLNGPAKRPGWCPLREAEGSAPVKVRPFYEQIGMHVQVFLDGAWHNAVIEDGYRTHDGIINARIEDGRGFWCGDLRHGEFVREVPDE